VVLRGVSDYDLSGKIGKIGKIGMVGKVGKIGMVRLRF